MYIFQNALKNIGRNKGRYILLGIIIFAMITTTAISLIINNTSNSIINDYKGRFGSKITLTPDIQSLMGSRSTSASGQRPVTAALNFDSITAEQYLAFADSQYLQSVEFTSEIQVYSETITAIDQDAENNRNIGGFAQNIITSGEVNENFVSPTLRLIGNSNYNTMTDFIDGVRMISEGRFYEADNECIISEDLAYENEIAVGDVIEVISSRNGETYSFTVVGIYADATDATNGMPFAMAAMNRRNEILTSFETLINLGESSETSARVTAAYYLKEPGMLEAFEQELRAKGLPDSYLVSTDEASYNTIVKPVMGLKNVSLIFLLIVLILGAVILILLSSIAIRERKYEIGVLRAMGMRKTKVVLGLLCEMTVLTGICLIIGLTTGTVAAQSIATPLLEWQNNVTEENTQPGPTIGGGMMLSVAGGSFSSRNNNSVSGLSEIDVKLGFDTIWQITLIAVLLAGVSSIMGIANITKYEPIKILSERN